jgi:hypothetical protein
LRRYRDPESDRGHLTDVGEVTPGELVEYQPRLVETIEGVAMPSVEDVMWAHHQNLFRPRVRPHRIAFNTHRSLRRG